MIPLPDNLNTILNLIKNKVPESLHLEYKAGAALVPQQGNEIAKDVSAFANADGGIIIYGVAEDPSTHLPLAVDAVVDQKRDREWLEQIILGKVNPRIEGIEIRQFPNSDGSWLLCVGVPKSFCGPHQAGDSKYYRRFNFSSVPMEHYEIEDVRARRRTLPPLVVLDMSPPAETALFFILRNIGNFPATDLSFKWAADMKWPSGVPPKPFKQGIHLLVPGKVFRIINHGTNKVFDMRDPDSGLKFDIEVSYMHGGSGQRLTEVFHFDVHDYSDNLLYGSEADRLEHYAETISRHLEELVRAVQEFSRTK